VLAFYGAMQEMTVRIAPEIKAEIVRAANEGECSQATVLRQAIRDWAIRRAVERARVEAAR
jgi:predicted transcriptional regulator